MSEFKWKAISFIYLLWTAGAVIAGATFIIIGLYGAITELTTGLPTTLVLFIVSIPMFLVAYVHWNAHILADEKLEYEYGSEA